VTLSRGSDSESRATALLSSHVELKAMADYGLTMVIKCSSLKSKPNMMTGIQKYSQKVVSWHCSIIQILTRADFVSSTRYV